MEVETPWRELICSEWQENMNDTDTCGGIYASICVCRYDFSVNDPSYLLLWDWGYYADWN